MKSLNELSMNMKAMYQKPVTEIILIESEGNMMTVMSITSDTTPVLPSGPGSGGVTFFNDGGNILKGDEE